MLLRSMVALEGLAAGGADLAGLAARVGFADQAHLSRTLRAGTGLPPGVLRSLLAGTPERAPSGRPAVTGNAQRWVG